MHLSTSPRCLRTLCLSPLLSLFSSLPPAAQCALFPTFIYQPEETLIVEFDGRTLNYSGQVVTVDEVKSTPLIGLPSTSALINQNPHKTNYVFIMVDPGMYNNTGTIDALHYIQTDLRLPSPLLSSDIITIHTNTTFYPLRSHKAALAPYIAPDLTVGEAVHKYTQLLFRQPEKFTVPEEYKKFMPRNLKNPLNRAGFPLGEFVDRTGLGEPVAGNYFDVLKVIGGTDGNGKGSSAGAMSDVWSGNRKVIVQIVLILAAWALW